MGETLKTTTGVEIRDIVRFFYGDGPAAQFEAGQKQGGSYCCVGCSAHSGRFSDRAYCYRAPKRSETGICSSRESMEERRYASTL